MSSKREIKYFCFLISPLLGIYYSIKDIKSKSSLILLFLFSTLWGLSYNIPINREGKFNVDASSYRTIFETEYLNLSFDIWYKDLISYLTFSGDINDFYYQTVFFLVSRFTSNYHVLYMVLAAIFSMFMVKSLKFLVKNENFDISLFSMMVLFLFLNFHIMRIDNLRFPTGLWVAVYMIFKVFIAKNNRYYLLFPLLIFIHSAYYYLLLVIIVYYVLGRFRRLWIVLFIFSCFLSSIMQILIENGFFFIPPFLQHFVGEYLEHSTDDELLRHESNRGFVFYSFYLIISHIYLCMMIFVISLKTNSNAKYLKLINFLLVLYTTTNFLYFIPIFGRRFEALSIPIIAYVWIVYRNNLGCLKKLSYLAPFVFSFQVVMDLYLYANLTIPYFWFFSPIITAPLIISGIIY